MINRKIKLICVEYQILQRSWKVVKRVVEGTRNYEVSKGVREVVNRMAKTRANEEVYEGLWEVIYGGIKFACRSKFQVG